MKSEVKKIKSTIFENFTKITNENEKVRIAGTIALIQQLEKSSEEKVNKFIEFQIFTKIILNRT